MAILNGVSQTLSDYSLHFTDEEANLLKHAKKSSPVSNLVKPVWPENLHLYQALRLLLLREQIEDH